MTRNGADHFTAMALFLRMPMTSISTLHKWRTRYRCAAGLTNLRPKQAAALRRFLDAVPERVGTASRKPMSQQKRHKFG